MPSWRLTSSRLVVVGLLAALAVAFFLIQVAGAVTSAGRAVGIGLDMDAAGRLLVFGVVDHGPADRAGLAAGDQIVAISGQPVSSFNAYDRMAELFAVDQPVVFEVIRGGRAQELTIRPGMPVGWLRYLVIAVVLACCLAIAWYVAQLHPPTRLTQLVSLFSLLLALELAIPRQVVGHATLNVAAWSLFFLTTGLQMGVGLHLVVIAPRPLPWLRPWWVPAAYVAGCGLGLVAGITTVVEALAVRPLLPWTAIQAETALLDVTVPIWAVLLVTLLVFSTLRQPVPEQRLRAGMILAGMVPLAAYDLAWTAFALFGREFPDWTGDLAPLMIVMFPLAVFVAIFQSHLFDLELVSRRSLLYSVLTSALLLLYLMVAGLGGALFSDLIGSREHELWLSLAAMLVLAVLAAPLRAGIQHAIDRRLLPIGTATGERLMRLGAEILELGDSRRMSERLVARLREALDIPLVVLLLTSNGRSLQVAATSGETDDCSTIPASLSIDAEVAPLWNEGRCLTVDELARLSPALAGELRPLRVASVAPLVAGRPMGILLLGSGAGSAALPQEHLVLLEAFCRQVATAFENVDLQRSATVEALTGVLRREAILELLESEVRRALRYDRPLSVALADLDRFKSVNDTFGHLAGDLVLGRVGRLLASRLREGIDAVGRYGGDEFLLVFPETEIQSARLLARGIEAQVASISVATGSGHSISPSLSIGVATSREIPGELAAALSRSRPHEMSPVVDDIVRWMIDAADRDLYAIKRSRGAAVSV